MKKEITPEMYNYNKFPGPKFERFADQIQAEGIRLNLVEDYKDTFDVTAFEQRYSALMLKFDYIVGDWGNEQLRLKGFYKDDKPVVSHLKISRLQDYLLEYCNYGCAYFVLENPEPQVIEIEDDDTTMKTERRRRRRRSRMNKIKEDGHAQEQKQKQKSSKSDVLVSKTKRKTRNKQKQDKFTIKTDKIERRMRENKTNKIDSQTVKREFVIRQK